MDRRPHADVGDHAKDHDGVHLEVAQSEVEVGVEEGRVAPLDDIEVVGPGIQILDDLHAPGPFHAVLRALQPLPVLADVSPVRINHEQDRAAGLSCGADHGPLRRDQCLVPGQDHRATRLADSFSMSITITAVALGSIRTCRSTFFAEKTSTVTAVLLGDRSYPWAIIDTAPGGVNHHPWGLGLRILCSFATQLVGAEGRIGAAGAKSTGQSGIGRPLPLSLTARLVTGQAGHRGAHFHQGPGFRRVRPTAAVAPVRLRTPL